MNILLQIKHDKTKFYDQFRLVIICLLILLTTASVGQTIINYGNSRLLEKQIQYEKYTVKIIPHIQLKDQYSTDFNIVFEIKWFDKKGRPFDGPDNIFIYLVDNNNNLTNYCNSNSKKLKDFRKNVTKLMFPSSIRLTPKQHFILGHLNDGFVKRKSHPLKVKIKDYYTSTTTLELILYFGKTKKDELIILAQSVKINWEFILPEPKSDEGLSCKELVRKYTGEFNNCKSPDTWSRYENKYDLNLSKDASLQEWQALKNSVVQYKSTLDASREVLMRIQNTKDTLFCEALTNLKDEIRSYLSVESRVEELANNINSKIAELGSGAGSGGGFVTSAEFKKNALNIERYYKALWDIKNHNGITANQKIISAYEDSIAASKKLQDSIMNSIGNTDKPALAEFYAKSYDEFYRDILELTGNSKTGNQNVFERGSKTLTGSKKKGNSRILRMLWYIIPVVILLIIFMILRKFFPKYTKILMLKNRFGGKVRK